MQLRLYERRSGRLIGDVSLPQWQLLISVLEEANGPASEPEIDVHGEIVFRTNEDEDEEDDDEFDGYYLDGKIIATLVEQGADELLLGMLRPLVHGDAGTQIEWRKE